ncbi:haloacid dehalogenase type II [Granulicella sp. S156]|uniref:haloacid dehalogenase type II n=1 Tax=Granulicella sp. S156 TaxID=1747224 RepID=UPI001C207D4C|nr:haloacid dehalogenase type II [Granulicella sp. S156]
MDRREFVTLAAGSAASSSLIRVPNALAATPKAMSAIKFIAFDAFPIFDPGPVFALADGMFPGVGLSNQWRTRQFEYTWLRVASQHYVDFWQVTDDALTFAANALKLNILPAQRTRLMNAYLELQAWPDVLPALASLRKSGLRFSFLSNLTPRMLHSNIKHAGLDGFFEQILSTDQVKTYKPAPQAYQMGLDAFKAKREEILFVASAGWDAAGAKLFGYPTYWVNRQKLPAEELGVLPDGSGNTLSDLVQFLGET